MMTYFTSSKEQITLAPMPLAKGGEGEVFRVIHPNITPRLCAKIYFSHQRTKDREMKIKYISKNNPTHQNGVPFLLCFPREALYDIDNNFVGFLMPEAFNNSIQLYELVTAKTRKNLHSEWHHKYNRETKFGVENRLKICVNLASAVHSLHHTNHFTLVDFKPQNILVTNDAQVSIIDLDSIQVSRNNCVLFYSKVSTPEYTPKECERIDQSTSYIAETWDRFSLAVVFYELLFGIHPYTATATGQYSDASTISEKISNNLFVHGSKKAYLSVIPPAHKNFDLLPQSLKDLFFAAFEAGGQVPSRRPTAEDWGMRMAIELRNSNLKPSLTKPDTLNPPAKPTVDKTPSLSPQKTTTPIPNRNTSQDSILGWITVITLVMFMLIALYITRSLSDKTAIAPPYTPSSTPSLDPPSSKSTSWVDTTSAPDTTLIGDTASISPPISGTLVGNRNLYGAGNGKFFFWTRYPDSTISVWVDGKEIGKLDYYFTPDYTPDCKDDRTLSIILPVGTHTFKAQTENYAWDSDFEVKEGECLYLELKD